MSVLIKIQIETVANDYSSLVSARWGNYERTLNARSVNNKFLNFGLKSTFHSKKNPLFLWRKTNKPLLYILHLDLSTLKFRITIKTECWLNGEGFVNGRWMHGERTVNAEITERKFVNAQWRDSEWSVNKCKSK